MAESLALILLTGTAVAGVVWVRMQRFSAAAVDRSSELIVVLGAALHGEEPCPELARRLAWAAALQRRGLAPSILCSGGFSHGRSEPAAMRAALVRLGVPEGAIELDESGTSTRRTVLSVARRVHAADRVIFVSSAYHLPRIAAEARRRGIRAIAAPVPQRRRSLRQEAREVVATCAYAVSAPPARFRSSFGGRIPS